ncbi:mechanosensitive ion channel domain-containing protein [Aerosakkonema sp. BLCC-F183]|uniref:mechanosensitive ion channel domain-containing protein n=1 Tax=Aerosakkonema sp. BLCC-F183 TaxID=3342834 RepID=UPI0035BA4613
MTKESLWMWGLTLIIAFPLANIGLAEGVQRLQRRRNPLSRFLDNTRKLVLPTLAVLLVMRLFLGFENTDLSLQIVQTVYWVAAMVTCLSLINAVLTAKPKTNQWQIYVPGLFYQVARMVVILVIIAYILAAVWEVDLSKVAEALGIGSLVIALALQDTLSNLVSGFLLLFESPFKLGDWIRVGELEGEVIELNWRAVRLKTRERDVVIIPNGVLGGETIYNYTLLDPVHVETIEISFPHSTPPNLVKRVLNDVALTTKGVLTNPAPEVLTKSYGEYTISYDVRIYIRKFTDLYQIRNDFVTRIYYAAKRYKLGIALPVAIEFDKLDVSHLQKSYSSKEIAEFLRTLPYFFSINPEEIDKLAQTSTWEEYGLGEEVILEGQKVDGLYIIREGRVKVAVNDIEDREHVIAKLSKGEIFGDTAIMPGETSPVSVAATDDLTVIIISRDSAMQLIDRYPKFALEINQFIEERKKALVGVKGTEDESNKNTARNGYLSSRRFIGS